ncbi:response regulator [Sphingobacterium sp. SG20118]|uniref:response regulator n=1 Tax=Sphingobacterium sp. SG20118 TaxID=3367156 RepID=UPI0037DFC918
MQKLVAVSNGADAIHECMKSNFDLILMDVQMPEVDGIEATKQIRQLAGYHDIPIIGITAGNVSGEREKCLEAGMSEFLPKPIRQLDLNTVLQKFVQISSMGNQDIDVWNDRLDLTTLTEQIGDDPGFKSYFLDLVITEVTQTLNRLKNARSTDNIEDMRIILHKLRGTTSTSGLVRLAKLTTVLEKQLVSIALSKNLLDEIEREIEIGLQLITKLKY